MFWFCCLSATDQCKQCQQVIYPHLCKKKKKSVSLICWLVWNVNSRHVCVCVRIINTFSPLALSPAACDVANLCFLLTALLSQRDANSREEPLVIIIFCLHSGLRGAEITQAAASLKIHLEGFKRATMCVFHSSNWLIAAPLKDQSGDFLSSSRSTNPISRLIQQWTDPIISQTHILYTLQLPQICVWALTKQI